MIEVIIGEIEQQRRLEFERAAMPFMRERLRLYEISTGVEYNEVTKEFSHTISTEVKKGINYLDEIIKMYWNQIVRLPMERTVNGRIR